MLLSIIDMTTEGLTCPPTIVSNVKEAQGYQTHLDVNFINLFVYCVQQPYLIVIFVQKILLIPQSNVLSVVDLYI